MITELSYEERCAVLEKMGIDPKRLQRHNPVFFRNIIQRIKGHHHGMMDDPVPDSFWWEEGNPGLWEKCKPKEKPKGPTHVQDVFIKLRKKSNKWKRKGKFRKV